MLLEGVPLPNELSSLVRYALHEGASGEQVALLLRLPERRYDNIDEVAEELLSVQPSREHEQPDSPHEAERCPARRRRVHAAALRERRGPTLGRRLRRRLRPVLLDPPPLRLDDVLRVARRLEAGLEDGPAQAQLAGADERSADDRRGPALPPALREQRGAGDGEPLRRPRELAGLALAVDLADRSRAAAPSPASARLRRARRRRRAVGPGRRLSGGTKIEAAAPALAAALAPKIHGSSCRPSCQTGMAVSATSTPVYVASGGPASVGDDSTPRSAPASACRAAGARRPSSTPRR